MIQDSELLRRYAETDSEEAFAELVQRHLGLVYSAAVRQVNGNAQLAQDVAQLVFADLARKAAALSQRDSLTGWLFTSTHFAAAKAARAERRRHKYEHQALDMHELLHTQGPEQEWGKLGPALDKVMHQLRESDRELILMRYFENRPFEDISKRVGLTEDATRKRVERALEKLRTFLLKRGITTSGSLATILSTNAVQIPPAGLAANISAGALVGTALHASSSIAVTKAIAMTTLQKTLVALTIAVVAGTGIYQANRNSKLRAQVQTLQQQQGPLTEQIQHLQHERDEATRQLAALRNGHQGLSANDTELLRLRGQVGVLRQQNNELAKRETSQVESQAPAQIIEIVRAKDLYVRAWLQAFFAYAKAHEGQCPESCLQAASFLPESVREISQTADQFELLYHGSLDAIQGQDIIVFREKSLWQHVGGKWGRFYGIADGHAQYCSSSDKTATGSFAFYESEHSAPSAGQ